MNYKPDTYNIYQLLEIFPEAKTFVKRKTKDEIEQLKKELEERLLIQRQCTKVISTSLYANRWFWQMVADILIIPNREEIEKKLKQCYFLLAFLKPKPEQTVKDDSITEQDIIRAKQIPLSNFLKILRSGFSRCELHTDKTPSLKVYEKQNKWYCFSCHAGGDVIDLIMKLHNKDFHSAIRFLINK